MVQFSDLRLLVVDDTNILTEALVGSLKSHGVRVQHQLVDDQDALFKALRQPWDLLLFVHAFDLTMFQVKQAVRESKRDVPMIRVMDDDEQHMDREMRSALIDDAFDLGVVDAIARDRLSQMTFAIRREHTALESRREIEALQALLQEAEQRAQTLLRNSKSAVAYVLDGVHIYANSVYLELFDVGMDDLIGMPIIDLIAQDDVTDVRGLLRDYAKGDRSKSEVLFHGQRLDMSTFDAVMQLAPATYEGEHCLQVIMQRQTDDRMSHQQLAERERRDSLTGLGNRLAFEEALNQIHMQALQGEAVYALLYISLDELSQVVAKTSLAGSDRVIVEVAELLAAKLPSNALMRFNDTSFTALISVVDSQDAIAQAERLQEAIAGRLVDIDKRTVRINASIGAAMINSSAPSTDELMHRAYTSAQTAREHAAAGVGVKLYSLAESATAPNDAMRDLLNGAIETNQFELVFQPLYDMQSEGTRLFEVFLRLPMPNGDTLMPKDLLPIAHQYGLDGRLDRWVLLNASKRLRAELVSHPNTQILVNLSAASLQDTAMPELMGKLVRALGSTNGHPLSLQFTESDVTTYLSLARANINAFQANGCPVSLNQFGLGPDALSTLRLVDADMAKVDRSLSSDLSDEKRYLALQNLVNEINTLGKEAIVTHIENATEMTKAWALNARYLQGVFLQPPSPTMQTADHV